MEDCEANCVVLRSLLGSCLSDIDKNIPCILLPEEEEDCSFSHLLNLKIDELKKNIRIMWFYHYNNNIVKFVKSTSGYGGNYNWSMFLLENSLTNNYFSRMNISRYNKNIKEYLFHWSWN